MKTLPRLVNDALAARLRVMPAVVLTGARQTGQRTLVEKLVPGERRYHSLDDFDVLDAARRDPEALLGGDDPVTLDGIQREPGLLTAVKRAIDRNRRPRELPHAVAHDSPRATRSRARRTLGRTAEHTRRTVARPAGGCR